MKEHYDKQNEEKNKVENTLANKGNKNELPRPNIAPTKPTYVAKAPRK
jgi:hypothetical protein